MTARDDLDVLTRRQGRRMNRWRRQLRDDLMAAFAQRTAGREKVDTLAYALLRLDIERIYSAAYARWPGDVDAPLGRIIRGDTLHARALAWLRETQAVARLLPRSVVRAIREAA